MNNRLSLPSKLINLSELVKTTIIEKGRHYQSLCILEFSNSVMYVLKAAPRSPRGCSKKWNQAIHSIGKV